MSIIRVKKYSNYSVISNIPLQDKTLSWKAKGILAYLLTKPDNWKIYSSQLEKQVIDGKTATVNGIKELVKAGYISKEKQRNEKGQISGINYTVYEEIKNNPYFTSPEPSYPEPGFPESGFPVLDKQSLLNTDKEINTKKNKKEKEKHIHKKEKDISLDGKKIKKIIDFPIEVYTQVISAMEERYWDSTINCNQYPGLPFNLIRSNPIPIKDTHTSSKLADSKPKEKKDNQPSQSNPEYQRLGLKLASIIKGAGKLNPRTRVDDFGDTIRKIIEIDLKSSSKKKKASALLKMDEIFDRYQKWIGEDYTKHIYTPNALREKYFDLEDNLRHQEKNRNSSKSNPEPNGCGPITPKAIGSLNFS